MTYLWKEEKHNPIYRIQTDEKELAKKLKRSKKFNLSGEGVDCQLWLFQTSFYSPQKARNFLSRITNRPVQRDKEEGVYFA